ncbi:hypothetical protein [Helicobacter sp. MIT 05-5293]|nr:hypothetical protein [Helicobacter sp. MIT 05-5293]
MRQKISFRIFSNKILKTQSPYRIFICHKIHNARPQQAQNPQIL